MHGIDHELVEIALRVDGDEAGQRAVLFGHQLAQVLVLLEQGGVLGFGAACIVELLLGLLACLVGHVLFAAQRFLVSVQRLQTRLKFDIACREIATFALQAQQLRARATNASRADANSAAAR